jgi:predicted Zn-ribbon and HTH transcriptional regulator
MFDSEVKGFKSHWKWQGLYYKKCVMCGWVDKNNDVPLFCPQCKAIMIQPEPHRFIIQKRSQHGGKEEMEACK